MTTTTQAPVPPATRPPFLLEVPSPSELVGSHFTRVVKKMASLWKTRKLCKTRPSHDQRIPGVASHLTRRLFTDGVRNGIMWFKSHSRASNLVGRFTSEFQYHQDEVSDTAQHSGCEPHNVFSPSDTDKAGERMPRQRPMDTNAIQPDHGDLHRQYTLVSREPKIFCSYARRQSIF